MAEHRTATQAGEDMAKDAKLSHQLLEGHEFEAVVGQITAFARTMARASGFSESGTGCAVLLATALGRVVVDGADKLHHVPPRGLVALTYFERQVSRQARFKFSEDGYVQG